MKKPLFQNPNVKMLQDNFGLTQKDAQNADVLLRQYIAHSGENKTTLLNGISKIIQKYVPSESAKQWNDECQRVLEYYNSKNNSWMWGENLFCIVAYIYTFLCLIIDAIEKSDWLNKDPANPFAESEWILLIQFLTTVIVIFVGNKFVIKHRNDKKIGVWFSIANKVLPTATMLTYLFYYAVKLIVVEDLSICGEILFTIPAIYAVGSIATIVHRHRLYKTACDLILEVKMEKKKGKVKEFLVRNKVPLLILLGIFLVVGVPVIIHAFFKGTAPCEWFVADWDSGDVLGYYGGLLGVSGAAVGIWATIQHEQKKYREDVIRQSLPYFIMTTLRTKVKFNPLSQVNNIEKIDIFPKNQYEEYPLDKIYYVIQNGSIKAKSQLTDAEQKFIEHGGIKWERNGSTLSTVATKYISMPFEIENAGNGASSFTKIGFNMRSADKKNYINAIPLKVGQKIYIHILCEDVQQCDKGIYDFEIYYFDIFMNPYLQKYMISIQDAGEDVSISIETYAKQEKRDFPDKPENE